MSNDSGDETPGMDYDGLPMEPIKTRREPGMEAAPWMAGGRLSSDERAREGVRRTLFAEEAEGREAGVKVEPGMAREKRDVGSERAFPLSTGAYGTNNVGMSLRDWFAGRAMAAYLSVDPDFQLSDGQVARWSYAMADAMVKARED